eukprot:TRINITY_DN6820_c0_g1_i7.p2 TRINITY_DN6820_c0_g1~~TRINITY_DN6820_c0_g1_i7.p2  ORF type:complete len:108 (+),score=30.14 TRINITY_DN6820_c0_g1_i7:55-378(+)
MAIRHLETKITKDMASALQAFIKTVLGKKYEWTPMKMYRRNSVVDISSNDRTFFCSELVARAYKSMGLLRESLSSGAYLPGSFSARSNLVLLNGAQLSDEYEIEFNN